MSVLMSNTPKAAGRNASFSDNLPLSSSLPPSRPASSGQNGLATKRGQTWSTMPIADASGTFFTPAKLDHQAYSKPRCDTAAPNVQLVLTGLKRKIDHYHYSVVSAVPPSLPPSLPPSSLARCAVGFDGLGEED